LHKDLPHHDRHPLPKLLSAWRMEENEGMFYPTFTSALKHCSTAYFYAILG